MAHSGRVVVGVSGSLRSLTALHRGVEEARRRGGELMVVHAWTPPGAETASRRAPWPPLITEWEKAAAGRLHQAFQDAFGGFPQDLALSLATACGESGRVLTELADRPDDLLVIGAGRRGRLARIVHGGVGRYCLANSRCPVLAVPPSELMRDLGRTARLLDELPLKPAA